MAVKIRLSRFGKKHAPQFRIVAVDSRSKRDGRSIEDLGTYNPQSHTIVQFNQEAVEKWISQGAILTDSVRKLQKQYKQQQKDQ